jgi:cytochrome c
MKIATPLVLTASLLLALAAFAPANAEVNAKQAEALMKSNKCSSCHHDTKSKSGPSLAKMAEKYKGDADAEATLITQMTTGPMVKNEDGEEEEHKIIKVKDQAQLKNLAQWILQR